MTVYEKRILLMKKMDEFVEGKDKDYVIGYLMGTLCSVIDYDKLYDELIKYFDK